MFIVVTKSFSYIVRIINHSPASDLNCVRKLPEVYNKKDNFTLDDALNLYASVFSFHVCLIISFKLVNNPNNILKQEKDPTYSPFKRVESTRCRTRKKYLNKA